MQPLFARAQSEARGSSDADSSEEPGSDSGDDEDGADDKGSRDKHAGSESDESGFHKPERKKRIRTQLDVVSAGK